MNDTRTVEQIREEIVEAEEAGDWKRAVALKSEWHLRIAQDAGKDGLNSTDQKIIDAAIEALPSDASEEETS